MHKDIVQLCAHACVGPQRSSGTLASPYSALGARQAMAVMQACVHTPLLSSLFSIVGGATAPATARICHLPEWYQYGIHVGLGATAPTTARIGQLPEWYQYGMERNRASPASTFVSRPAAWCTASFSARA